MRLSTQTNTRARIVIWTLVILLIAITFYALLRLKEAASRYDAQSAILSSQSIVASTVMIGDKTLKIPSYDLFQSGHIWALVSKAHPLKSEASYQLVDIPVAHGDAELPMKVAKDITAPLEQLVNAAEADNEPLMVSSAYRSLAEQQSLYDAFVRKNGSELAALYVSPVGSSEHHTGLAVDLSSVSDICAKDSNSCSLSTSSAQWLEANAARFGFIERYPEGSFQITGVAHEPWHYRFVGVPLALAMQGSGMTYEEIVAQIAPGYAKD